MLFEESEVQPGWLKVPQDVKITCVGHEAVCIGKGCHLMFYNIVNEKEDVYSACKWETGEGVACYAGHRRLPVLAFAEMLINPRIFILSYPDLTELKILPDGTSMQYMTMTFSDHDILVTLSDFPDCEMIFWNWRTEEKVYVVDTHQRKDDQILCCSTNTATSVVQYYNQASTFKIWHLCYSYKEYIVLEHKIQVPNNDTIVNCIWSNEGSVFFLNPLGCVYMMNNLTYELALIIFGGISFGTTIPCFTWYKKGLLVLPTDSDIIHYKKLNDSWFEAGRMAPIPIKQFLPYDTKELLFAWTLECELMKLDKEKMTFQRIKSFESPADMFCFIYPKCSHIASLAPRNFSVVKIWNCLNGDEVSKFEFQGFITSLGSNPVYPYVAIGFTNGYLTLLNCYHPDQLKILTNFCLYDKVITKIVFSELGDIIVTGCEKLGSFFVIKGHPGEVMQILHYIDYRRPILDVCIEETEKSIKVYLLVQTDSLAPLVLSQRIVVKSITKVNSRIKNKAYTTTKYQFTKLIYKNKIFVAKLFNSYNICTITLQSKGKLIKIVDEYHSCHVLKQFKIDQNNFCTYTFGYDGLIVIRSLDLKTILRVLLPHHRYTGGVAAVIVDPYLRYVLSYGENSKEFVCINLLEKEPNEKYLIKEIKMKMFKMIYRFTNTPTEGFEPIDLVDRDGNPCTTYLEVLCRNKIQEEELKHFEERRLIMKEFLQIKKEVIRLLNENFKAPEMKRIDILEFFQHVVLRKYKKELNVKKCEWAVKYYNEVIRAQNETWETMKAICDDGVTERTSIIKGFFTDSSVESYCIPKLDPAGLTHTQQIELYREIENIAKEEDSFCPWNVESLSFIEKALITPPIINSEQKRITETFNLEYGEYSEILTELNNNYPYSTTPHFISPTQFLYHQTEIHTVSQILCQKVLTRNDKYDLLTLFNKRYNEIKQQKERDMNAIMDKNNTLRHMLSELYYFTDLKPGDVEILDPEWDMNEYAENIFTVHESEIGITPYVSPSEQAILDAEAAEAERIRLLLLADDFRERALMAMMHGVLEIRWEDTLRRQVVKPKCMKEKTNPANLTIDDLKAIQEYEDEIILLNSDIKVYINILQEKFKKISKNVREIIFKFDQTTLKNLLMYKMVIETAVIQNNFLLRRLQYSCIEDEEMTMERVEMQKDLRKAKQEVKYFESLLHSVHTAYNECKELCEAFIVKDKIIEKHFKREFQIFPALAQEQGMKVFKKQPKMSLKNFHVVTILEELAEACVSHKTTPILTQDCSNYLKSIEYLDKSPGIPRCIDGHMNDVLCRHRRVRLQNEIKMRINAVQLSNVEHSIKEVERFYNESKQLLAAKEKRWRNHRNKELDALQNKYIQIVTHSGLVELQKTGSVHDYDDAILVNAFVVEGINAIVKKAGERKLKLMQATMLFRREIMQKEWEHKKLSMEIEDLNEELKMIDTVDVTREVIKYLQRQSKGIPFDTGLLTYEQEIESRKKSYESLIKRQQASVDLLDKKISEYKKKNKVMDGKITEMNLDLCEKTAVRDVDAELKHKQETRIRLNQAVKRSKLIKQIQDQHQEIIILQTKLELLKIRTYPTLTFDTLGDR